MSAINFDLLIKRFSSSKVLNVFDDAATTIQLEAGRGSRFNDPATDGNCSAWIWNAEDYPFPGDIPGNPIESGELEIIEITGRDGDVITGINRPQTVKLNYVVGKKYKIICGIDETWIAKVIDILIDVVAKADAAADKYTVSEVDALISNLDDEKVDRVAGYGLSKNDLTDLLLAKLNAIEVGATADQTGAEIKAAYEAEADTNAFTDSEKNKLSNIEENATADQTGAEIKAAYEAETNTNAFTDAEKSKLAGLESSKFLGQFISLAALQAAHPSPEVGSYAFVDAGVGQEVQKYIWDSSDSTYYLQSSATTAENPASIKQKYESNADTNAFTDAEKNKLTGVESNANNYQHPSNHPASIITQDSTHRFVSDTEKATWNGKAETKADVGLGDVQNYGIASQAEAEAGTVTNKYVTPFLVKKAIEALAGSGSEWTLINEYTPDNTYYTISTSFNTYDEIKIELYRIGVYQSNWGLLLSSTGQSFNHRKISMGAGYASTFAGNNTSINLTDNDLAYGSFVTGTIICKKNGEINSSLSLLNASQGIVFEVFAGLYSAGPLSNVVLGGTDLLGSGGGNVKIYGK